MGKQSGLIKIEDVDLARRIDAERQRRGHGTMAATVRALLIERLTIIETTASFDDPDPSIASKHGEPLP